MSAEWLGTIHDALAKLRKVAHVLSADSESLYAVGLDTLSERLDRQAAAILGSIGLIDEAIGEHVHADFKASQDSCVTVAVLALHALSDEATDSTGEDDEK